MTEHCPLKSKGRQAQRAALNDEIASAQARRGRSSARVPDHRQEAKDDAPVRPAGIP